MPWFKIDDGFWSHPKVLELSDAAIALWVRAGSYCAGHLTDGEVKLSTLRVLGADRDAATELVLAGLWDIVEERWYFHDWVDYQPTREQVLAEREAATERKRRSREKSQGESRRDVGVTHGGSHSPPSRPVPTRPDQVTHVSKSSHVSNRESENDSTENTARATLQAGLQIDPDKLIGHISQRTARQVSASQAMRIATHLLDKGSDIKRPQAYVLRCITDSWSEVQQYIDTEVA